MVQDDVTTFDQPAEEDTDVRRTRRKGVAGLVAVAVLLALVIWWILTNTVIVPDVDGMGRAEATMELAYEDLAVGAINSVPSTTSAEGAVVVQTPLAGQRVVRGSLVDLGLAATPLGQKDEDDGRGWKAFGMTRYPLPTDTGPDETPEADGQPAPRTYYPDAVGAKVPSVHAKTADDAIAILEGAGYGVTVKYGPSTSGPDEGLVFFQEPAPGEFVGSGANVEIWVSTGGPHTGYPYPRPEE